MAYLSPKTIIVDFLRKNITDPRVRITTKSQSFTATAGQTILQLVPTTGKTMSHINSVTVNTTAQTKWQDYYIDPKNQKIIFFTGLSLADAVVVSFGEGTTNWIYPDKANAKLNATSFPRMNVLIVSAPGTRQGNYEAPVEASMRIQIDIWCKEKQDNQIFTIDSNKYTGVDLAEYLSWKVTESFEDNEKELFPALYGYDPVGMPVDLPFDEQYQCHHKVVEFIIFGLKVGRIS